MTEDTKYPMQSPSFLIYEEVKTLCPKREKVKVKVNTYKNLLLHAWALCCLDVIGKGNDCLTPFYIPNGFGAYIRVRCKHCINCQAAISAEWSLRLAMELNDWKDAIFVTLTYNNEHLPYVSVPKGVDYLYETVSAYYPSNHRSDLSNFIKRLRKHSKCSLKYFGVCEYGTRYGRPHLHCLIYGLPYTDRTKTLIDRAWNYAGKQIGFVRVDPCYGEGTLKYVAGYVMKKLYAYDENTSEQVRFRLRERSWQSQHLGERWFFANLNQLNISARHPWIDKDGYKVPIPQTFRKKLVDMGILLRCPMDLLHDMQIRELKMLYDDLKTKGISDSDFWKYRKRLALVKRDRKNSTRQKTGDI